MNVHETPVGLYRRRTIQVLEENPVPITLCPPQICGQNGSLLYALFTFLTDTMISKMTCEPENVEACQRKPTSMGLLCLSRRFEQVIARSFSSYQSGRTVPRDKQAAYVKSMES
jgi:hypothetical protein